MFSLWRKARRENSAASRLLGSTSLRFALHGWQRKTPAEQDFVRLKRDENGKPAALQVAVVRYVPRDKNKDHSL
ncbi:hypothetical protein, partial [Thiolapillus sp.]